MKKILFCLLACAACPTETKTPPPLQTGTTGNGTVTQQGTAVDYHLDADGSSLLLLVKKKEAAVCKLFHHHAMSAEAVNFTFALNRDDPSVSTFRADVLAGGLDPDQPQYRDQFDETRGTTMNDGERSDIRANMLDQVGASDHPVLVFEARNLTALEGSGTADVAVNIRGQDSTLAMNASATWEGTTLTLDGTGTLSGSAHGIPNGSFSDCVVGDMTLKMHLVLVPGASDGGVLDASVPAFVEQHFADESACHADVAFDDVKDVLALNCGTCHGSPTQYAAPQSLDTWDGFHKDSARSPGVPLFTDALERIRANDGRRMPPPGFNLSAPEKALLESWFTQGAHQFRCDSTGAPLPAQPEPRPVVCSANESWPDGGTEGPRMNPGKDCLGCHYEEGKAEQVVLAGTVYPSLRERDTCSGVDGRQAQLEVRIKDARGRTFTLPVNSNGNFVYAADRGDSPIALPYNASVYDRATGHERAMFGAQTITSCNHCHTERGFAPPDAGFNPPPGRIVAPGVW